MTQGETIGEAISLLQELGLKEYEARCFVALTQLSRGTAKEVSDVSEVPRTRVYDAIDVLEAHGLVAVQHGSPKRFKAVAIDRAARTLSQRKDDRIESLETQLHSLEPPDGDHGEIERQEVWSLSGHEAIQTRTEDLVAEVESGLVLLVVEESLLTDALVERLRAAQERGASVVLGGATDAIADRIEAALPSAQVYETDLGWLMGPEVDDEIAISRVLLTDQENLLVGSFYPYRSETRDERAIVANGLSNGVVVLLRRLIDSGLTPHETPPDDR